jgi:hypothetical protein
MLHLFPSCLFTAVFHSTYFASRLVEKYEGQNNYSLNEVWRRSCQELHQGTIFKVAERD